MRHIRRFLPVFVAFAIGYALVERVAPESNRVTRPSRPKAGTELLAVFLVSTSCPASTFPGLNDSLAQIRAALERTAAAANATFVTVGVALDADPWEGVEFIKTFGDFDEVISGGSWMNTAALSYVSRELPGQWSVPQLVLVERDVVITERDQIPTVSSDRLVARKVGVDEIATFASQLRTAATN